MGLLDRLGIRVMRCDEMLTVREEQLDRAMRRIDEKDDLIENLKAVVSTREARISALEKELKLSWEVGDLHEWAEDLDDIIERGSEFIHGLKHVKGLLDDAIEQKKNERIEEETTEFGEGDTVEFENANQTCRGRIEEICGQMAYIKGTWGTEYNVPLRYLRRPGEPRPFLVGDHVEWAEPSPIGPTRCVGTVSRVEGNNLHVKTKSGSYAFIGKGMARHVEVAPT